jgi:hypothetical protein
MIVKEIWDWLNDNSGVVSAVAALMGAVIAMAGVIVAAVYTRITSKLAGISDQQREILAAQHKLESSQVKYMLY